MNAVTDPMNDEMERLALGFTVRAGRVVDKEDDEVRNRLPGPFSPAEANLPALGRGGSTPMAIVLAYQAMHRGYKKRKIVSVRFLFTLHSSSMIIKLLAIWQLLLRYSSVGAYVYIRNRHSAAGC